MGRDTKRRELLRAGGSAMVGGAMIGLAGCGGDGGGGGDGSDGGSDGSGDGGSDGGFPLTATLAGQVTTLDPMRHNGGTTILALLTAYEQLIFLSPYTGELVPKIATDWEYVNEEKTTLRLTIREGVKFHNGATLTPEDIVFSFERSYNSKSNDIRIQSTRESDLPLYESSEVVDGEHAVDLHLKKLDPLLVPRLGTNLMIVNKKWMLDREPREIAQDVNGTGAWKFEKWVDRVKTEFSNFDDYWGEEYPVGKITYLESSEAATRTNQLLAGETDIVKNLSLADVSRVENSDNAHVATVATDRDMFFAMRTVGDDDPPTTSRKFRLAMNYATSTKALVEDVLNGLGKPLAQPVPDYWTGHNPDIPKYGYPQDKAKAEQLVEESGYAGATVKITGVQGHYLKDVELCQAVTKMIDSLSNVSAELNLLPTQDWSAALTSGRENIEGMPTMYLLGWGSGPPDGTVKIIGNFSCRSLGNYCSYCNAEEIEPRLDEALRTTNKEKRAAIIREMCMILHEDAAAVFTHRQAGLYGVINRLKWGPPPDENIYPEFVERAEG